MATSSGSMVQPMPPFDPDNEIGTNLAPKWKIWIEDFQMYLVATGITDKKRQRTLLLYQAGARVREIFRQLSDTGGDFEAAVAKLNEYFEPQKHRLYEVYKFRQAAQENIESIDQYQTRLRSLAERCQFENMDFEIMLQIVLKGSSSRLRKQALRDPKMTLKDLPVKMKGKFQTTVESRKKITVATIYVTEADGGCLLSANTAEDLGLITLHLNQVKTTKPNSKAAQQVNIPDKGVQHIVNNHSSVFQGQGKLQNKQIELIIDEAVKPVAQKQRPIPFHLREKVERELSKLEHDDIIEPVPDTEETDWISPLVIVPKKDDNIRLCVDMRAANNAIKRVRHPIPNVKDVSLELNGAKFFTKLDLTQAYHQLELSPSSRHITTFVTHTGIYRFKRLNYGTNSAAEVFQHTLQQVLQGIKGVRNIADDILIFGSTYEEHNTSLEEFLQRLEANGPTLNLGKCLFLKQNLDFFGLVFSKDCVSPDPKQISALANSTTPTTPSEVRSLLGMANFSAQFIPNFATITEPLRMLTHKNIPFTWGDEQENAYQTLKTALISKPVMSYFDPGKETVILVDASPVGLCAILAQRARGSTKTQTISYGSRALTSTEKRYSQTEKEALAIVWGYRALPSVPVWGPIYTIHRSQTA